MKAFLLEETKDGTRGRVTELDKDLLSDGDTLIKTSFAGLNYKDALAGTGRASIARRLPLIAGIEAVGRIIDSAGKRFQPGDWVIAHGMGMGVDRDGGLSEYLRADENWLVGLPEGLKPIEAASLGVAGFSAALAVDQLENTGIVPGNGPIAVTGASGGVGSLSIAMLSRRGFDVTAISRKRYMQDRLLDLGAVDVAIPPATQSERLLDRAVWAGSIDTVGGDILAWLIRTTQPNGMILSVGNAGGNTLNTNVVPFILRGISLVGINANSPTRLRRHIWNRLSTDLKPENLIDISREIDISDIPEVMRMIVSGKTTGRYVVNLDKSRGPSSL